MHPSSQRGRAGPGTDGSFASVAMRPPGSPWYRHAGESALHERDHRGGDHPIPFRTRQLSPTSPKVLRRQAAGGQVVPLAGGAFCVPAALTGRPDLPTPRLRQAPGLAPCSGLGAARRPLGPEAGQFRAPAGPSPTSSGEPVRQNYIIIWTPMRASFCFCAPLTVKWERLLSLKI